MNNAMIAGLNVENPGETKKRAFEDLALVRESLEYLQNKLAEGLSLDSEESEQLTQLSETEKTLEAQLKKADNDLSALIAELQDSRKKSSDLMDMGKAVQFKEGVSIDNVNLKRGFAREITPRRNKAMIEADIQALFERNKETIKAKSLKSVFSILQLFYPNRPWARNKDCSNKQERETTKTEMLKFWKAVYQA